MIFTSSSCIYSDQILSLSLSLSLNKESKQAISVRSFVYCHDYVCAVHFVPLYQAWELAADPQISVGKKMSAKKKKTVRSN